jgi:hypothetical protein
LTDENEEKDRMKTNLAERAGQALAELQRRRALLHNITNYVVMDFSANALLALGASPVMAHAAEEVREMVALAGRKTVEAVHNATLGRHCGVAGISKQGQNPPQRRDHVHSCTE